ncbi:MAG: hypothetical protein AB8B99_14860 [Phormidesmis sp.]
MDLHHRLGQHRVRYIIDSYMLMGAEPKSSSQFESYIDELFAQYPYGLIELALVETLSKSWLTIPMQKGVAFLSSVHERLKQWQVEQRASASLSVSVTPSQFSQITGLDPQIAFASLVEQTVTASDNIPQHVQHSDVVRRPFEQGDVEQSELYDVYPTSATVE